MKNSLLLFIITIGFLSCKNNSKDETELIENKTTYEKSNNEAIKEQSAAELKAKLTSKGYQIFDYVDEKTQDTVLMQQYFIAFLKKGPIRSQNEEEAEVLQKEHLAHLGKMYDLGYADISGPFGDDGDIRGITIYNVPTLEMADSLANSDPMVKAGRLAIEIHPWWAAKGFPLR
ncbi:YciI family protein [Winogradskyella sp. R77965]|uniref:YciI family protein n=1 Tax=Winogradskyella sp. R77965 TaxID=3093872 RepID=UPI0037DC5DB1